MNKRLIIIIILVIFVIIPLVVFGIISFISNNQPNDNQIKNVIDRDTGVVLTYDETKEPETDGNSDVIIIGIEKLIDDNFFPGQIDIIKGYLNSYATGQLNDEYTTITLIPSTYKNNNGIIAVDIRLGQSDTIVPAIITMLDTGETQLRVAAVGTRYSEYDSGSSIFEFEND
jgi:hypothetical protein